MRKVKSLLAILLFAIILFSGCGSNQAYDYACTCPEPDPALAEIFETWEVFEFIHCCFPEMIIFASEHDMYYCDTESVTVSITSMVPERFGLVDGDIFFSLVKYVDGQWRVVPREQLRGSSWRWIMRYGDTGDFATINSVDLYLDRFTPGLYRVVAGFIRIAGTIDISGWSGPVWAEFVVRDRYTSCNSTQCFINIRCKPDNINETTIYPNAEKDVCAISTDWEIYEFVAECFPDIIRVMAEYHTYTHEVENVKVSIASYLPERFGIVHVNHRYTNRYSQSFTLVKYVNGAWRVVPFSEISLQPPARHLSETSGERVLYSQHHCFVEINGSDLYLGRFTPGLYRIVVNNVIVRVGHAFKWATPAWVEFTITGE